MGSEERSWRNGNHPATPGPWADEPDKIQWVDAATGLDCLIVREHLGALCGYVGLPPGHPLHGKGYNECLQGCENGCYEHSLEVAVHGGLTFSGACQEGGPESEGVCHVPAPGRPADVWWFGFDCAHSGDTIPVLLKTLALTGGLPGGFPGDRYRNVAYVRAEVEALAKQVAAVGVPT